MKLLFDFAQNTNTEYNINNLIIYNNTLNEFVPNYSSQHIIGWNNNYTITYSNIIIKIVDKQIITYDM